MSYLQQPSPPQSPSKQNDGEPQGSCFTLIGDHQCGILLGDVGQLAGTYIPFMQLEAVHTGKMKIAPSVGISDKHQPSVCHTLES